MRGLSIDTPGIPDGVINGLVTLHGHKPPLGVGDFITTPFQEREQNAAIAYAQTYNLFLLHFLLAHPDTKTRSYLRQVRIELKTLSQANPKKDALRSLKSAPQFLLVAGIRELGYSTEDSRAANVGTRVLLMNEMVLKGLEREQFRRVVKTYVLPYNRMLYQLLLQKWKREGIKNKAALY